MLLTWGLNMKIKVTFDYEIDSVAATYWDKDCTCDTILENEKNSILARLRDLWPSNTKESIYVEELYD